MARVRDRESDKSRRAHRSATQSALGARRRAHTCRIIFATTRSGSSRGADAMNSMQSPPHRSIATYVSAPTSAAASSRTTCACAQRRSANSSNSITARSVPTGACARAADGSIDG
jgi:hypothetical protein